MIALGGLLLLLPVTAQSGGCAAVPAMAGPGVVDPFRPPAPRATELNAAGKTLYRQGQWEAARAQYRAAEAVDPDFLAPRLNVACSFVRQERFTEATSEVRALLERAYVPWAREVLEAADLGALKVRPEGKEIERALAAAAASWGAGLEDSVVFVGRQRAPLKVPAEGAGAFILNPHQEAYAFLPSSGRFRQLTAEDGHVLAIGRSRDGRRLSVLTAQQLVRGTTAHELTLGRVAIGELTLATMTTTPPTAIEGGVRRIDIVARGSGFVYRIEGDRRQGWFRVDAAQSLVPAPGAQPSGGGPIVLTAEGVAPHPRMVFGGSCQGTARDSAKSSSSRTIIVSLRGRPSRTIGDAWGAGLAGLPIP